MAKVFSGGDFLKSKEVTVTFSNGAVATLAELTDKGMKALDGLGDEGKGVKDIREAVCTICNLPEGKLAEIGIVELRGVMDFLSESLFG